MSSYTISKKEYVKVAGYIAGIADSVSIGVHQFWVYDYKEHKNTDKDLYYMRFVQCYEMNAASVKEQYHGSEVGAPANDSNDYKKEFEEYYRKGRAIPAESANTQRQAIAEINHFFGSSLYQTENERYNFMMRHWYNIILEQLVQRILLSGYEAESWGSFEAPNSKEIQIIA